ncbi:MAG TPA: proton-conducting transporter membrane subunit [Candidatus Hydrogenedentes bacterium]|jgi:hydrogenase-4 component B|nr:hydrogenase [Candidatus Hydrogenedentota bacterium]MDY0032284.1 proton-conducting transporter membrane subunit [FCB group bacterium]HNZ17448.1 proton-conducting transporter membrane subunit [Candidatus Hydrogenedentota bacterium]
MILSLISLAALMLGGVLVVLTKGAPVWSARAGVASAVAGCVCGCIAGFQALVGGRTESLEIPWSVPGGALHLALDPLSAVFLIPITGLGALCAIYGAAYFQGHRDAKGVALSWFHYNLLVASMIGVVLARNALLFLVAWETMALASFFLVSFEHGKATVRTAGWIYLIACHLGTAFLLALFAILGERAGSLDFAAMAQSGAALPASVSRWAFVLALLGFGTKAGYIPVHVWLPEAHPAAPSHVSALMSGVMIKTGIYGLLRMLACLGAPAPWWGWCLLGTGLVSGILGVLFALAQHDIKRLLAYHSVENIGIITIGLGVGCIGLSYGAQGVAVLGFAGALLHVLNHAVFKGLLFLGAGAVLHGAGTGDIDHLGGLLKRMPVTGVTFLIGSAAICGLPPLNGFVSEFLIYLGAFQGVASSPGIVVAACVAAIAGLALIGGLAAACFTKAFGVIFLGEPRSEHAVHPHPASRGMRVPMLALAAVCVLIGLSAPVVAPGLANAVAGAMNTPPGAARAGLNAAVSPLAWVVGVSAAGLALILVLAALRKRLLAARTVGAAGTWDCGYVRPTARMQYTASSFAQPVLDVFPLARGTRYRQVQPAGVLPAPVSFSTETKDLFRNRFYEPFFKRTAEVLSWFRRAQHGRVQLYVLYLALALIVLLVFGLK